MLLKYLFVLLHKRGAILSNMESSILTYITMDYNALVVTHLNGSKHHYLTNNNNNSRCHWLLHLFSAFSAVSFTSIFMCLFHHKVMVWLFSSAGKSSFLQLVLVDNPSSPLWGRNFLKTCKIFFKLMLQVTLFNLYNY